ncbi:MAG TPA: LysM peptidoglycan-binding domain-containing protein [Opitutaceae bacterium]|nr:LysM peptidoglycan-binding domain-containing protein [Opitutaceae bacterium]
MRRLFRILSFAGGLVLALWLVAGCEPANRFAAGSETNDPQYRRGQQLLKQGRYQEALGAFLKAIDERGGDNAPESHLEAALIYQDYPPKEPIYAIYHFRRYLELKPNSRQADLVRQRIDAAMREFARTIPGQPLESQTARFELMDKIAQLQQENQLLKDQIAAQHGGIVPAGGSANAADTPAAGTASAPIVLRLPAARPPGIRVPGTTAPAAPAVAAATGAPRPGNAPPAAPRKHVVAQGDTLYKIAQRYYGNGSRWPEILQANRDVLKDQNAVRPGMELKIP